MPEGYYYLITSLPEISLSDKELPLDSLAFRKLMQENVSEHDFELIQIIYHAYDIENLITLIKKSERKHQTFGNFSAETLHEMLSLPDTLPVFLKRFVAETRPIWDRVSEKKLINLATGFLIDWSREIENRFLRKWLYFDHNLKNLLIWLNCKKFGLDMSQEIMGSHYEAEYLRNNRDDLDLKAWDFQFREALRHYANPNIGLRELIINEMRWNYLSELEESHVFGIERLLAFAIRLLLISRNLTDSESGENRLLDILQKLKSKHTLPEIYSAA